MAKLKFSDSGGKLLSVFDVSGKWEVSGGGVRWPSAKAVATPQGETVVVSAALSGGGSYVTVTDALGEHRVDFDRTVDSWVLEVQEDPTVPPPSNAVDPPQGMVLRWTDEFSGTVLDSKRWLPMSRKFGQPDRQLVNLPENIVVANGSVTLKGTRLAQAEGIAKWGCGGFWTRGTSTKLPLYHHSRVVFQTDHGQGYWPAIWLTDEDGGGNCEFDLFEGFHVEDPNAARCTLFCDTDPGAGYSKKVKQVSSTGITGAPAGDKFTLDTPGQPGGTVHTLDANVTPVGNGVRFRTWFDGRIVMDYTETSRLKWRENSPPEATWDMLINLQLSGPWVGDPDGPLGYLPGPKRTYKRSGLHRLGTPEGTDPGRALLPNEGFKIHSVAVFS